MEGEELETVDSSSLKERRVMVDVWDRSRCVCPPTSMAVRSVVWMLRGRDSAIGGSCCRNDFVDLEISWGFPPILNIFYVGFA